jgi:hypothetical protein
VSEEIVRAIVGRPLFIRKNEQTANIIVVLPIVALLVAIPYFYIKALDWAAGAANRRADAFKMVNVNPNQVSNPMIKFVPTITPLTTQQPTQVISVNVQVSYPTAAPTQIPTATADPGRVFYYTYYNPDVLVDADVTKKGKCANQEGNWCHTVNCWDYDLAAGECKSATASGQDFRDWWGKGLACASEFPLWTVFVVIEPPELAGRWTCIDRGPAVEGSRLDFLMPGQVIEWGHELKAVVELPK